MLLSDTSVVEHMKLACWVFINMSSDSWSDINCRTFVFEGGRAQQPPVSQGLLIHKVSGSHTVMHHS